MVRLFDSVAKRLGVLLAATRVARGSLGAQVSTMYNTYAIAGAPAMDELTRLTLEQVEDESIDDWDMDEAQRDILDALAVSAAGKSDGEVIDLIARLVSGPYARSSFGRDAITALRRALMDPRTSIDQRRKELVCSRCSGKFVLGALATVVDHGDGGGLGLWCQRCTLPTAIRCSVSGCEQHLQMPQRITQILRSKEYLCSKHQQEKASGKVAETEQPEEANDAGGAFDIETPAIDFGQLRGGGLGQPPNLPRARQWAPGHPLGRRRNNT